MAEGNAPPTEKRESERSELEVNLERRTVSFRGHDLVLLVTILAGFATMVWISSGQHASTLEAVTSINKTRADEHKALEDRMGSMADEVAFYLSLTEVQRAQYKMTMPPSLCKKLERHC